MSFEDVRQRIEAMSIGSAIPKPKSSDSSRFVGWGVRRSERAVIYAMPNHKNPSKPHKKGVTLNELEKAYEHLVNNGSFTREWFNANMPGCRREGACNFTTIGGLFELVGVARYAGTGTYRVD